MKLPRPLSPTWVVTIILIGLVEVSLGRVTGSTLAWGQLSKSPGARGEAEIDPKEETNSSDEDLLPVLLPTDVILLTGTIPSHNGSVIDLQFSADGQAAYVLTYSSTVNLWELAVRYWPENLAVLSGFSLFTGLIALERIRRRKQIIDRPHCRHCNYCLHGITATNCPECGRNLSNRRIQIGRSLTRRARLPLGLALLIPFFFIALHIGGAPRRGFVSQWFFIDAPWLYDDLCERGVIKPNSIMYLAAFDDVWPLYERMTRITLTNPPNTVALYTNPIRPDRTFSFRPINGEKQILYVTGAAPESGLPPVFTLNTKNGKRQHAIAENVMDSRDYCGILGETTNQRYTLIGSINSLVTDSPPKLYRYDSLTQKLDHLFTMKALWPIPDDNAKPMIATMLLYSPQHHQLIQIDINYSSDTYTAEMIAAVWDIESKTRTATFPIHGFSLEGFWADGRFLVTKERSGRMFFWDLEQEGWLSQILDEDPEHPRNIYSGTAAVRFLPGNRYFLSTDQANQRVCLYDFNQKSYILELVGIPENYKSNALWVNATSQQVIVQVHRKIPRTAPNAKPHDDPDLLLIYDLSQLEDF